MHTKFFAAALAVGLTLGVQPQGCQDSGKIAESFRYLAQDDDFHPPAQGEVTFYQTHGPIGGGSVQALAEGLDGMVYAGTFGDGVYVKATAEDRWRPAEDGPRDRFLMTLAVMPDGEVLAGTIRGGIFRSRDGGRRWTASNEGLTNTQVSAILHDPRTGTLYAGTGSGVFKSADGGRRWTPVNRGLEIALARALALGPDGTLYTGTGGNGLFASRDGGTTWAALNEGLRDEVGLRENFIRVLAIDRSGALYAGSFGGGIFRTTDHGRQWVSINQGLTNTSIRGLVIAATALYVGTGDGVYTSTDGGAQWESISDGMPDTNVQALLLGTNGVLYAGTGSGVVERSPQGVWRSSDRGMLFPSVDTVLADSHRGLFAGTRGAGLFRSKDAGETWASFNDGIASRTIRALVRDTNGVQYVATPETVYRADWELSRWVPERDGLEGEPVALLAAADGLFAATSGGVFERVDGSRAWSRAAVGESARPAQALAIDQAGMIYAAADGRVFRRAPATGRWDPLPFRPMDERVAGLAGGHALYARTARAVFRAVEDRREWRWHEVGAGLPKDVDVVSLAVDIVGSRDVLLAATSGGVWWNDDGTQWKLAHGPQSGVSFRTLSTTASGLMVGGSDEHGVFVGVNLIRRPKVFGLF